VATASLLDNLERSWISEASFSAPGYLSGKALKWLGDKGLNALEDANRLKRGYQYRYRLKRWDQLNNTLGMKEQKKLFKMLEDALTNVIPDIRPGIT
jgi:hypothetical protein